MVKIKSYDEIDVKLLDATPSPLETICTAANITMFKKFLNKTPKPNIPKRLLDMNHTSIFEHVNYRFLIEGATRSFLAQITRHRHGSFTSGSQHYQTYSDYGFKVSGKYKHLFKESVEKCMDEYNILLGKGVPKEEARQILPNGMENNLIWTVNARGLVNYLNLRLCNRNVEEMRTVSKKVYDLANNHFPELFEHVGPDCYTKGKCSQGKMMCKTPYKK